MTVILLLLKFGIIGNLISYIHKHFFVIGNNGKLNNLDMYVFLLGNNGKLNQFGY